MKIKDYSLLDKRYESNLKGSFKRWGKVLDFYYRGVFKKKEILKGLSTTFSSKYQSSITITKLEAEGLCPHHFLPTHYTAEITYEPTDGRVLGTSKAYMAFRVIAAQPLLMEDIFEEFFHEFLDHVKPIKLRMEMRGKYECNHKDGVPRSAEVILIKEIKT